MVEFAQRQSVPVGRRREEPRRIVHRELPWAEIASSDEELWQLVERYRARNGSDRLELNRALLLAVSVSLLLWLVLAFAIVELIAAR